MIFWLMIGFYAWTVIAFIYFMMMINSYHEKAYWYEWIIMAPALIIVMPIVFVAELWEKRKDR